MAGKRTRTTYPELVAMRRIAKILDDLGDEEASRVVDWVMNRHAERDSKGMMERLEDNTNVPEKS